MKRLLLVVLTCLSIPAGVHSQWKTLNGPFGGSVRSLYAKDSIVFAGTSDGGIFRSENYGVSWEPIGGGALCTYAIGVTGDYIFAGGYPALYLSSDRGISWEVVYLPMVEGGYISSLLVRDSIVLVGIHVMGVFRSSDHGKTWSDTSVLGESGTVRAIIDLDSIIIATYNVGITKSADDGETWDTLNAESWAGMIRDFTRNDTYVFAGGAGIHRSSDGGRSWENASNGLSTANVTCMAAIDSLIFAGIEDGGIYRSTDNGTSWNAANEGLGHLDITDICVAGAMLIASADYGGGIYVSTDAGMHWIRSVEGLTNTDVRALLAEDSLIIAGTFYDGVHISTDGGNHWAVSNVGLTAKKFSALAMKDSIVYAGTTEGMFRSTNKGADWTRVAAIPSNAWIGSVEIHNDLILAGREYDSKVYLSRDTGENWEVVGGDDTLSSVRSFVVSGDSVLAGSFGNGIFRSTDRGATWTSVTHHTKPFYVWDMAFDGRTVFAGSYMHGLYWSTDFGSSWTHISDYKVEPDIHSVIFVGNTIFASVGYDEFGYRICMSENDGLTWKDVSEGLRSKYVHQLFVDGEYLYAATRGAGIAKRPLAEMITFVGDEDGEEIPEEYELMNAYPNPFNPSTTISYSLSEASRVKLTIYNVLGQEIALLRNGSEIAGMKSVQWNATVPSGVYFCRMEATPESEAGKRFSAVIRLMVVK